MNPTQLIILFLIIFLLLNYSCDSKKEKEPSWLFLVNGSNATINKNGNMYELTMKHISSTAWTDRPYHKTIPISEKQLVKIVKKMDNIEKNPPNATLVGINQDKVDESIIEIMSVKIDKDNNMVFGFKILSGKIEQTNFSHLSLTIDDLSSTIDNWRTIIDKWSCNNLIFKCDKMLQIKGIKK